MNQATPEYSDRLKTIMAEIKAVLKKHDIAGYVLLHEPGFSEYLLEVSPTWSVMKREGDQVRIKSNLAEDFGGDREAQLAAHVGTASLTRHFADVLAINAEQFEKIHAMLAEHWGIEHGEAVHTPHRDH